MELLCYLGGVIVGTVLTLIIRDRMAAHGYFTIKPYDDPDTKLPTEGLYTVNVSLPTNQNLAKKKRIILHISQ